jgi:hypothetical protein
MATVREKVRKKLLGLEIKADVPYNQFPSGCIDFDRFQEALDGSVLNVRVALPSRAAHNYRFRAVPGVVRQINHRSSKPLYISRAVTAVPA